MSDIQTSPGEVGGVIAGLGVLGAGFKWLWTAIQGSRETRAAKLDRWHSELTERERALDAKIDARMEAMETQVKELTGAVDRWRMAFQLVASELLHLNPRSQAILQAQKILAEVYPVSLSIPDDMTETLNKLDGA